MHSWSHIPYTSQVNIEDACVLDHWHCFCVFGMLNLFLRINKARRVLTTVFATHHVLKLMKPLSPDENMGNIKLCFRDTLGDIKGMKRGMKCVQGEST